MMKPRTLSFMMIFTAQHVTNLSKQKRRKCMMFELSLFLEAKYNTLKVLRTVLVALDHQLFPVLLMEILSTSRERRICISS